MKKSFIFTIALTMILAGSALANDPVNTRVLDAFNTTFVNATSVQWTDTKDFARVRFIWQGQTLYAYYRHSGEQMAITRNIKPSQLPIALASDITSGYAGYYLADLFEVSTSSETLYYATLCKGNSTVIRRSSPSETWSVYKKEKKLQSPE